MKRRYLVNLSFILILVMFFTACVAEHPVDEGEEPTFIVETLAGSQSESQIDSEEQPSESSTESTNMPSSEQPTNEPRNNDSLEAEVNGLLTAHFIDVGQADCILVELPNKKTLLIDAGNNGDSNTIVNYINSCGITHIDYLVGTHPHEDHIGSLDSIISSFDIGKVYLPNVTSTTKTYSDVVAALDSKGLTATTAKAGISLFDEADLDAYFVAPVKDKYSNLNDYSAVLYLS